MLWHLQNVHCSITAHIRTKQVHLGDGEVGVLKSDGSFVFWSLHWAGLWGLGSVGHTAKQASDKTSAVRVLQLRQSRI